MNALLTCAQHRLADQASAQFGVSLERLMEEAGGFVASVARTLWAPRPTLVLCGPGGNGGDGYVAAHQLRAAGWPVRAAALGAPRGEAAAAAAARWGEGVEPFGRAALEGAELVIDALFGAGLSRPIEGEAAEVISVLPQTVLSVDAPSGVCGDTARPLGPHVRARATATFFRLKPVHVLQPGRTLCGDLGVFLGDIGHPAEAFSVATASGPPPRVNAPADWARFAPSPGAMTHKHARGRLCVVTGDFASTGAARLAARAGLRAGAGLVTLLAPPDALPAVAGAASLAVMTEAFVGSEALVDALAEVDACVLGPAAGVTTATRDNVFAALTTSAALALDADALSVFAGDPYPLFDAIKGRSAPVVLTPHIGEFRRVFPDIDLDKRDKISAAQDAALRSGAVVLLKGADTVIAEPAGRTAVNVHATPHLATAGSGDVLVGLIASFLSQGVEAYAATCAGAWLHGEAGLSLGAGLIAEDLIEALPAALAALRRASR